MSPICSSEPCSSACYIFNFKNEIKVDPNRSFQSGESCGLPSAEANALKQLVASVETPNGWKVHVDLHETTDSDESEFRPAKVR